MAAFHQVILASTLSSEEQQRLRRALEVPRTEAVAPVPRDDGNMLFYPRSPIFVCFQRGFFWAMFLHVVFFLLLEIHPIFEGESLKCKRRRCLLSHRAIGLKPARKFKKPLEIYRGKTVKVRLKPSQ